MPTKKLFSVFVLLLTVGLSVAAINNRSGLFRLSTNAATTKTIFKITPAKITPNQGYTATVTVNGSSYTGPLVYELAQCDLRIDNPSAPCRMLSGDWLAAVNGVVNAPANSNYPEKYYLFRVKPKSLDVSYWSNYDLVMVHNVASEIPGFALSGATFTLPPRGSYSVLENYDENTKAFLGYTRISVETNTDTVLCKDGDVWRYTKSNTKAYWAPSDAGGDIPSFRWCVEKQRDTAGKLRIRAVKGIIDYFSPSQALSNIKVRYNSKDGAVAPALLGGIMLNASDHKRDWSAEIDADQTGHYMLFPLDLKLPVLSSNPVTLVNTAVGNPMKRYGTNYDDQNMDIWHVEMSRPKPYAPADSDITYRQVENGYFRLFAEKAWVLTEDWTFNKKGVFTMIQQWWDTPSRCWDTKYQINNRYTCEDATGKRITAKVIDWYDPTTNTSPLKIRFVGQRNNGNDAWIPNGGTYELKVTDKDGLPYSGFLQLKPIGSSVGYLWKQAGKYPIYVHNGSVLVPPAAYSNAQNIRSTFSVRPYNVNSSINGIAPTIGWDDSGLIQNQVTVDYSNEPTLTIGAP